MLIIMLVKLILDLLLLDKRHNRRVVTHDMPLELLNFIAVLRDQQGRSLANVQCTSSQLVHLREQVLPCFH